MTVRRRTTNCETCGTSFEWLENTELGWTRHFCSKSCRRRASQARRTTNVADAAEAQLRTCARCGIEFAWTPPADFADAWPPEYHSATCQTAARKARQKARAAAGEPAPAPRLPKVVTELPALPPGRCGTCGKVAEPTKAAAKKAKAAVERHTGRVTEVCYYQCPEGWWHWTSREATKDAYRRRTA